MNKAVEEPTPLRYLKTGLLSQVDFADTFSTTNRKSNLKEITQLIFNNPPKWINYLFLIRNKIVGFFGLKVAIPADYNETFAVGGYVGFFRIYAISDHEIVLGADDSHLNFRSIIVNKNDDVRNIKLITLVQYNNTMGKIYMSIIKPFHQVVIKGMLKNAYKVSIE